jgi:hypothetical protein
MELIRKVQLMPRRSFYFIFAGQKFIFAGQKLFFNIFPDAGESVGLMLKK